MSDAAYFEALSESLFAQEQGLTLAEPTLAEVLAAALMTRTVASFPAGIP